MIKFSGALYISDMNFVSQQLPALVTLTCFGWVNKYCFIHSLVSCPVSLSRSLFLYNAVTAEGGEETSFNCYLCNSSPMFRSLWILLLEYVCLGVRSLLLTVRLCHPLLGIPAQSQNNFSALSTAQYFRVEHIILKYDVVIHRLCSRNLFQFTKAMYLPPLLCKSSCLISTQPLF